jgi:hypothetical protein
VVAVVEDHHRLPLGRVAGDLDGVLDRLGARVEQRRPLLEAARGQLVELLADSHIGLVRGDHEAGVGELLDLPLHGLDDERGAVADIRDGDAGGEVDPLPAVDVGQRAAASVVDIGRNRRSDAAGHRRQPALVNEFR